MCIRDRFCCALVALKRVEAAKIIIKKNLIVVVLFDDGFIVVVLVVYGCKTRDDDECLSRVKMRKIRFYFNLKHRCGGVLAVNALLSLNTTSIHYS